MSNRERLFLSSPHMGGDEFRLVQEVFDTNWVAPAGPMLNAFEQQLSELTGFRHVAALSSGTAALHLALRLSDVGGGDEVWGSTMTFIGGVAPIIYQGAVPVFLDIERDGLMLDLDLLEQALCQRTQTGKLPKAVISTDLYGHVIDSDRMQQLRDRFGFTWISDSAEAVGSYRAGQHAGKAADFAIYSFNGNKIITTSGGGALAGDNPDLIEQAKFLSTQAREHAPHYEHCTYGYNYRLSGVCAAIGIGQLKVLERRVAERRQIHEAYRSILGDIPGISFSSEPAGQRSNRWLTTILIDEAQSGFGPEDVRLALEAENIESRPLWKPMHLQPVFSSSECFGGGVAQQAFEVGLCLPSGSQMTPNDIERVTAIIRRLAG